MIVRTMERALLANCFESIVCATDSELVAEVVSSAGFEFVMTGPAATGSDRVAEAAKVLGVDLVVNLQGDEPLVEPVVLSRVASELERHPDCWVTVACPLDPAEATLATVVKVKVENDLAVDFTRHVEPEDAPRWFQHQGIYAYSRESRDEFAGLSQNAIERERSLEQMRILGRRPIRIVESPFPSVSVDVPSDAVAVEALIQSQMLENKWG